MTECPTSTVSGRSLDDVVEMVTQLGRELRAAPTSLRHDVLARAALRWITGARSVSVATQRRGRFESLAATDDRARRADEIQFVGRSGPCIDALRSDDGIAPAGLRSGPHSRGTGSASVKPAGFPSVLSLPLTNAAVDPDKTMSLTMYGDQPSAFTDDAVQLAQVLALHGAAVIAAEISHDQIGHLYRAVDSSRTISAAVGVLMVRHHLTYDGAVDLLRVTSQDRNRRMRDLAADVVETGELRGQRRVTKHLTERQQP